MATAFDDYLVAVGLTAESLEEGPSDVDDEWIGQVDSVATEIGVAQEDEVVERNVLKERLEYLIASSTLLSMAAPKLSDIGMTAKPSSIRVADVEHQGQNKCSSNVTWPEDWEVRGQQWRDRAMVWLIYDAIAVIWSLGRMLATPTISKTTSLSTTPLEPPIDELASIAHFLSTSTALDRQVLLTLNDIGSLDSADTSALYLCAPTLRQTLLDSLNLLSSQFHQCRLLMTQAVGHQSSMKEIERHEREAEEERVEAKKRNRLSRDWEFTRSPLARSTSTSDTLKRRTWTASEFEAINSVGMAQARSTGIENGVILEEEGAFLRSPYHPDPAPSKRSASRPISINLSSALGYASSTSPYLHLRQSTTSTIPSLGSPLFDDSQTLVASPLSFSNLTRAFNELHVSRRQLIWTLLGSNTADYSKASEIIEGINLVIEIEARKVMEAVEEEFQGETMVGATNMRSRKRGKQRISSSSPTRMSDIARGHRIRDFAPRNRDDSLASFECASDGLLIPSRSIAAKLHLITNRLEQEILAMSRSSMQRNSVVDDMHRIELIELHDSIRCDLDEMTNRWKDSRILLRTCLHVKALEVGYTMAVPQCATVGNDNLLPPDDLFSFADEELFTSNDRSSSTLCTDMDVSASFKFDSYLPPPGIEEIYESNETASSTDPRPTQPIDRADRIRMAKLAREEKKDREPRGVAIELSIIEEMKVVLSHRNGTGVPVQHYD